MGGRDGFFEDAKKQNPEPSCSTRRCTRAPQYLVVEQKFGWGLPASTPPGPHALGHPTPLSGAVLRRDSSSAKLRDPRHTLPLRLPSDLEMAPESIERANKDPVSVDVGKARGALRRPRFRPRARRARARSAWRGQWDSTARLLLKRAGRSRPYAGEVAYVKGMIY